MKDNQINITKEELTRAMEQRFPKEICEKLQQARVAVAGIGGLGSNIAMMLARTGIGHIFLVDFDIVDITNLNRQAYGISHLGRKKTDAIVEILRQINPYLDICTENIKVTEENAAELFKDYPIVCEAFDRPEYKAMLVNTLLAQCPDSKIIAASGMAGFGKSNDILTRQVMKNLYLCGDMETDSKDTGLMAPRVCICAGHQANMVINLILTEE